MNGAIAEPPPMTIKTPISSNTRITGTRKNFLRSFRKLNKSFKNSIVYSFGIRSGGNISPIRIVLSNYLFYPIRAVLL